MRNSQLRATLLLLALLALAPAGADVSVPSLGPAGLAALCLGLGLLGCAGAARSRRRDVA